MTSALPTSAHRHVPLAVTAAGELQLGERHTEFPKPLVWTGDGRPCTVCKQPAMWRRPTSIRGAATHPGCEAGAFDEVSEDLLADIEWELASCLGATGGSEGGYVTPQVPKEQVRLGRADAGCEICGRPYAALWLVSGTWRCAEHDVLRVPAAKRFWFQ